MERHVLREVEIKRVNVAEGKFEQRKDLVAEETPLHVFLNQTHYATILCSPSMLTELAVGHLFSEGVLHSLGEIREVCLEDGGKCVVQLEKGIDAEKRVELSQSFARLIVSACGGSDYWPLSKLVDRIKPVKVESSVVVKAGTILESIRRLNSVAETFRKTGGVHVASLNRIDGGLVAFAEDVGRHNAVDKVIGVGVLGGVNFGDCFLALSGRLSGDIVLKAARLRVPVVVSQAAALGSGVDVAERLGVTLVGFVRGSRMNIYARSERVVV